MRIITIVLVIAVIGCNNSEQPKTYTVTEGYLDTVTTEAFCMGMCLERQAQTGIDAKQEYKRLIDVMLTNSPYLYPKPYLPDFKPDTCSKTIKQPAKEGI